MMMGEELKYHIRHKARGIIASFVDKELRDKVYGTISSFDCVIECVDDK